MEVTGIIAILLFVVASAALLYFTLKSWPVYQVILVFFVMLFSGLSFYLSARLVKTKNAWAAVVKSHETSNETLVKENSILRDPGVDADKKEPGGAGYKVTELRDLVKEATAGRSRVWGLVSRDSNQVITGTFDGQSKLELSFNPKEPPELQMTPGMMVYAFAVTIKEVEQVPTPVSYDYLGYFKVDSKDAGKASLSTIEQAIPEEKLGTARNTRVVLYEDYPADRHPTDPLWKENEKLKDLVALPPRTEDEIRQVFAAAKPPVPKEVIEEYLRDGKAAPEKDIAQMTDAEKKIYAGRIWWDVKFVRDEITRDDLNKELGLKAPAAKKPSNPNNPEETVEQEKFVKDQVVRLDPETAKKLIEKQIVVPDDKKEDGTAKPYKIFVRQLRDYPQIVRELRRRAIDLRASTAETLRLTQVNEATIQLTNQQIANHETNIANLKHDIGFVTKEGEAVEKYMAEINTGIGELRKQREDLLASITQKAADIEQKMQQIQTKFDP